MNEFEHNGRRTRWINGYRSKYAITEDGQVLSFKLDGTYKEVKAHPNDRGYNKIKLSRNGKYVTRKIHRLVMETFYDIDLNKLHIDHIDGDKLNNHYTNLRWCTQKENVHYHMKMKHGEGWMPQDREPVRTREEIRLASIQRKQEKRDSMTYGSIESIVEKTGIHVIVDGIEYASAGSAAEYIVKCEKDHKDIDRNKKTISKELRRMAQGKRKPGKMYGRYNIEPVL